MAVLFVKEKFVDPYIVTIDSTLLKAKGHLWHKSSMIEGIVLMCKDYAKIKREICTKSIDIIMTRYLK